MDRPVTLREVAQAAGVSTASASRALAGDSPVSADLRRRIRAAADRLGYLPNLAARSLAGRRSGLVGVVVHSLADPLIADVFATLEGRLSEAGYGVLLALTRGLPAHRLTALRGLLSRGVDALVLADAAPAHELAGALQARAVPCLTIGEVAGDGPRQIDLGHRRGAALAGRYLLDLGHRRIGVIAPPNSATAAGVVDALGASGLSPQPQHFLDAPDLDAAQAAMRLLLHRDDPPTAVICGSDLQALAATRECLGHGLSVPLGISIIGFGDAELARRATPALTTLRIPAPAIGVQLADSLLLSLERGGPPPGVEAAVKLVVRESTRPAPR